MTTVLVGVVDVRDHGADPLGAVDATAAINAAFTAAKAAGAAVRGLGGTFKVLGTVTVTTSCDFTGSVFVGEPGAGAMVRIADDAAPDGQLWCLEIVLPEIRKGAENVTMVAGVPTWQSEDSAVLIEGLRDSLVLFGALSRCMVGIHVRSTVLATADTAGNDFRFESVVDCQTGIWLECRERDPGEASGGIVHNTFRGGACLLEVAADSGERIAGTALLRLTGWTGSVPMHNAFRGIGVQGTAHAYAIRCEGSRNRFTDLVFDQDGSAHTELVYFGRPVGNPEGIGGEDNLMSGAWVERFTDASDALGQIELGSVGPGRNLGWSLEQIGRADDLGGGWVELLNTYSPTLYVGLVGLLDFVAAQIVDVVGHSRVYNRHRHPRKRIDFEAMFVDSDGLEFWTVRRTTSRRERVGNRDAVETVHTVLIEGHVAHVDSDVDADATEHQMQVHAEAIADALRPLVTMGGLAERSWLGSTTMEDVEFAGIACHRVQMGLQAQVFATD